MKIKICLTLLLSAFSTMLVGTLAQAQVSLYPSITAREARILGKGIDRMKNSPQKVAQLVDLAEYHLKKPGERKPDLDSCMRLLARAKKLSSELRDGKGQLRAQIIQAILEHERGNNPQAKASLLKTVHLADQQNALAEKARALYELGIIKGLNNGQAEFEQAAAAFRAAGDTKRLAKTLVIISDWEMAHGVFDKPYARLLEAIKYDQPARAFVLLEGISYVYKDQTQALKYGLMALQAAKKEKNQMREAEAYAGLGETYRLLSQDQNALSAFHAALAIMGRLKMMTGYYDVSRGIAYTHLGMGNMPQAIASYLQNMDRFPPITNIDRFRYHVVLTNLYGRAANHSKATEHHEMAKDLVPKGENPDGIYSLTRTSAEFYYRTKSYEKARALFVHGNKVSGENVGHLLRIASIDSINGDLKSALAYTQRAKKLNDSLLGENRSKLVAGLQIRYELNQKEADLLLKDAELKLKDQRIGVLGQNALLLEQSAEISAQQARLNASRLIQSRLSEEKNTIALKLKDRDIQSLNRKSALQKLELQQEVFTRKVTVALIGLFLLVAILLVRQYRLKQRNSRIVTEKNRQLEQLVSDKDWLLREMHHRVKNNLHTVMSLLESQSAYLENDALLAIQNSQNRIFAMSLIHQKLYQSDEVRSIDMAIYIPELINHLRETIPREKHIGFAIAVEAIEFEVSDAVPLGLIVNEVITNSIKYAFEDTDGGEIAITLTQTEDRYHKLIMTDNGIGLPGHVDFDNASTLGLRLIKGLSEQLEATLDIQSGPGTTITIVMPAKPLHG